MHPLYLLTTLLLNLSLVLSQTLNTTESVDQLFLQFTIDEVLRNNTEGLSFYEPWATDYVTAIKESRFGDAVWARYHMTGGVHDGVIDDTNYTVLEEVEDDAQAYMMEDPDSYAAAVSSVYEQTSTEDGHVDVIEIIVRVGEQDLAELRDQYQAEDRAMCAELCADFCPGLGAEDLKV